MMDTQKMHIDHENLVDEAIFPLRCFSDMLGDMNLNKETVSPVDVGVSLRALVEKCATDLITAMDTAGRAES